MKIQRERPYQLKNTAVCIGKFDGLHNGHKLLIDSILEYSELEKVLFTFSFPGQDCIYSDREKRYLAEQMGIDTYIDCPFDEELSHMSPEAFLQDVLVGDCGAKVISVGEDFCFGYQRAGNVEFLRERQEALGYELNVFQKKKMMGSVVSSTRIREALSLGKLSEVNELLGHPYFICGEVVHGNQLGRTVLNMPTANQVPQKQKILPPFGVYASRVRVADKAYTGVTNIGVKPTIPGENQIGVETYIMAFDEDIYGKEICVELYDFLRGEMKFSDFEELRAQMEEDKRSAILFFEQ